MTAATGDFARRVVRWQRQHGRHDLPWQGSRDPYAVWLSEIMLQQTQVATVSDYFGRFMRRFPTVQALAEAGLDEVLALWSGLGYYRRASLLHQCARRILSDHGGQFPRTAAGLVALPGIGRSTAAAIASLCFGERVAILDGNVKRVLTRLLAFEGDLADAAQERALWALAQELLPKRDAQRAMPAYTQGLMDLGATVCLARRPDCAACPVRGLCQGFASGEPTRFPVKSRKLKRRSETLWLLLARRRDGAVWLMKRPATGIWAGLYCLPVFASREELVQALGAGERERLVDQPGFVHVLTHRDLHLQPVGLDMVGRRRIDAAGGWHLPQALPDLGLPAPIRKLLSGCRVRGGASA